ncbi:MAG: hypothetical protein QOI86_2026 [Actinomycetota bacterium]|nr:hypothetical protein [Actinomycetota bacterium]
MTAAVPASAATGGLTVRPANFDPADLALSYAGTYSSTWTFTLSSGP